MYADQLGNHNANVTGTPTFQNAVFGKGAKITSSAGYANSGVWNPSELSKQLSISMWVNWTLTGSSNAYGTLLSKGNSGQWGEPGAFMWRVVITDTGRLLFDKPLSNYDCGWQGMFNNGQTQHICITYDGAMAAIYVNGIKRTEFAHTFDMGGVNGPIVIGANQADGYAAAINSIIDDAAIYNYAVSENQVRDMYLEGPAVYVCPTALEMDLDGNCKIDVADLAILVDSWLECNVDPKSECSK
jgi:hypothetical protein